MVLLKKFWFSILHFKNKQKHSNSTNILVVYLTPSDYINFISMLIKVQKEQNLWDVIIITKIFISTYETIKLLKAKKAKFTIHT